MDRELVEYFDQRFRDTTQQIVNALRGEMDQRFHVNSQQIVNTLRGEMDQRFRENSEQIVNTLRGEMDQRFRENSEQIVNALRGEMDQRFHETSEEIRGLRGEMNQRVEEVKTEIRQTDIKLEALRGEVQIVAEGVAANNENLDRFREEVAQDFKDSRALTHSLFAHLENRVSDLEGGGSPRAARG